MLLNARSFAEQVGERQFALNVSAVLVVTQAIGRDKREMYGLFYATDRAERLPAAYHALKLLIVKHIFPIRVFHFAKVDYSVLSVKQQVDLHADVAAPRPLSPPRIDIDGHPGYSQRLLYLPHVRKAQALKGKTSPCMLRPFRHEF